MKQKKYEKSITIIFLSIVLFIIELICIYNLSSIKIIIYKKYTMIINNETGILLVPKEDKKIWYKNKYIYWNDKKIEYKIESIEELKKEYQLTVTPTFKEKMKESIIIVSIEEKRINMIEAIISCWGGDKNN